MESRTAWGTECRDAFEAVAASVSVLGRVGQGANSDACDPDPLRQRADACLDGLAEVARGEARMAALKVHLAAEYADAAKAMAAPAMSPQESSAQEMGLVAEVACVLRVSERTAGALLSEAHELTTSLPLTLSALQAGTISWQHARILVDETSNLDPDGAKALEAHFLDPDDPNPARGCPASELVPARFRHKARTWRERHHPVSIEKRHTRSVQDRRLEYAPDRDGMAWLSAYLPADQAAGIWERTTSAARALQGPHEGRTLSQLRADIAATWLFGVSTNGLTGMTGGIGAASGSAASMTGEMGGLAVGGGVPSPRAQVLVTVPVMSLLGVTDEPATLDGYGPIPPSMARQLIANGAESFHRVLIDPRDGAPLEIGRTSYRLTKAQRQWLRLRDGKCPFPGCSNHSLDNETDHLLAWAHGGTTGISNLGQPCPKHHRLRHTTAWTPTTATKNEPPGWISPTGRHYASEHPDWEPPHWPDHLQAMAEQSDAPRPGQSGHHRDQTALNRHDLDRDVAIPEEPSPGWAWPRRPDNDEVPDYPLSDDLLPEDLLLYCAAYDDDLPDPAQPEDPFPHWALLLGSEAKAAV